MNKQSPGNDGFGWSKNLVYKYVHIWLWERYVKRHRMHWNST